MDVAQKVHIKLEKILSKLKALQVIENFELKINFLEIKENMRINLKIIDSILKKCLKRIITKPKKAEIRNVITELVRKKNLNYISDQSFEESQNCESRSHSDESFRGIVSSPPNLFHENSKEKHSRTKEYLEIPKEKSKYLCDKCGKIYKEIEKWKKHEKKHFIVLECNFCLRSFRNMQELNRHHQTHKPKAVKMSCENFSDNLFQFKPLTFSQPSSSVCPEVTSAALTCRVAINKEKIFPQKMLYKKTKKAECEPPFICSICEKSFTIKKSLQKHISLKHSNKTIKYVCSYCQKSFFEKAKLNRHMLSHSSNQQYQCFKCYKRFVRSDTLKRHILLAHDKVKEYACCFCKKNFSLKYNKDIHENNVHNTASDWFQCELCGQKFKTKSTLKSHKEIHSVKRISCSLCNKLFAKKIHYKRHMRSHHFGVSPYQTLMDSVTREETDS